MSMWNTSNQVMTRSGVDDRVPGIKARYHFPASTLGKDNPIQQSRGNIATIRLLNANAPTNATSVENKILRELASSSDGRQEGNGVTSFLLQSVSYQDSEKSMVMQTFGDDSAVYFLGRSPRMMSFNGILLDDAVNNWFYKFMVMYDSVLRGTKIARKFRSISVTLHNCMITGVIMDMSYSQEASTDNSISFSFSMLVKQYQPRSAYESNNALNNSIQGANSLNASLKKLLQRDLATLSSADIRRANSAVLSIPDTGEISLGMLNTQGLTATRGPSNSDLIGQLIVHDNSFGTFVLPYVSRRALTLDSLGDPAIISNTTFSAPGTYSKNLSRNTPTGGAVHEFLYSMERGLRDISSWFNNTNSQVDAASLQVVGAVKTFLDPVTKIVKAGSTTLTSIKTIVSTVQTSIDRTFEPLVQLRQDYNEMRRNLDNTIGAITNLPDTVASKISNNIRLVKYKGMASLGGLSNGVTSAEAAAVLARLQPTTVESLGVLSIQRSINTESRVLAL